MSFYSKRCYRQNIKIITNSRNDETSSKDSKMTWYCFPPTDVDNDDCDDVFSSS